MHGYPLIDEARKETRKNHENATKKREKHENKSREHEKTTKIPRKARKHHEQHENAFLASKDESHENTKTVKNVKTVKIVKIVIFTREKPVWPWKTGMAVKIWYGLLFWFSWSWAVWLWKRWSNGPPGVEDSEVDPPLPDEEEDGDLSLGPGDDESLGEDEDGDDYEIEAPSVSSGSGDGPDPPANGGAVRAERGSPIDCLETQPAGHVEPVVASVACKPDPAADAMLQLAQKLKGAPTPAKSSAKVGCSWFGIFSKEKIRQKSMQHSHNMS